MDKNLTIIVPTFNNSEQLEATLDSIVELSYLFSLIIVDSSSYFPLNFKYKDHLIDSLWVEPSGVYSALNEGIRHTNSMYMMCLNSGDIAVTRNLKEVIETYIVNFSGPDVILGSQDLNYKGISYSERPTFQSIWPHQSVIYKRVLHDYYGFFNTDFKLISDQLFFVELRHDKSLSICSLDTSLTIYDLTGMSSVMNLQSVKEFRFLNEIRGRGNIKLYIKYVFFNLLGFFKLDHHLFWHLLRRQFKGGILRYVLKS